MIINEKDRKYTSEEYLAMSELEWHYELIDGNIIDTSPNPNLKHQRIRLDLGLYIANYIDGNCLDNEVFFVPLDVTLNRNTVIVPDIFVMCDKGKFDEHGCVGTPDWVIEILSPHNSYYDTVEKLALYQKSGVREYWIVDPMNEKVLVYPFEQAKAVGIFTFAGKIIAGIYKDNPEPLVITINEL